MSKQAEYESALSRASELERENAKVCEAKDEIEQKFNDQETQMLTFVPTQNPDCKPTPALFCHLSLARHHSLPATSSPTPCRQSDLLVLNTTAVVTITSTAAAFIKDPYHSSIFYGVPWVVCCACTCLRVAHMPWSSMVVPKNRVWCGGCPQGHLVSGRPMRHLWWCVYP